MRFVLWSLPWASVALIGDALARPHAAQSVLSLSDEDATERAEAVKEAFQHAWKGYKKYAFPHDELHPVSNGFGDSRNGWGASAVDALSTALIMRDADIVNQILDFIPTIDYTQTNQQVSLFETTIRYLAGMLSGYDLLTGPLADLASDSTKVDALLSQSKKLADILKFAFDTPSGVPYNGINITSKGNNGATSNGLAVTGTLVLEWTRLSDLTQDQEYANLSQKAESYLLNPQPATAEPFPGLVGSNINIDTGLFENGYVSWNGGDDSFYEYLLKMYVYDPLRFGEYLNRWEAAVNSTMAHLTSHPASRPDLTFLATYNDGSYGLSSQHLTCFDGGSFLLGGSILERQDLIDYGLQLVDSCYDTYNETATGIGPEQFSWDSASVPSAQQAFYQRAGFYIQSGYYILRPEVIESIYYAYRITKDQKYQEWAWDAFVAINATCRTDSGFSGITDVNAANGGSRDDNQESFLFAEVLKYSYLIHAPGKSFRCGMRPNARLTCTEDEWQIQAGDGQNTFVFNTEAHPIRVAQR
ncbi:hypothetical protein ASPZODRAFT_69265 [Penicilliopsis zonata CBS 506.65]|uniref:alpha-1,2-Mannosidase n=1 Tax=Penicilliopsis zonata CBS 506.65 TaxID=1073090 RepID=A0A1L9SEU7_9EURO|nr:hypothetical protein ASPZODRAFT_69265 [Penicilliopsis zonata CBS 506.65]OJJ45633.1 hypothetical protein ASPZODRAFT_69265 [Penicilliopsis zonata CBS 506.65]